MKFTKFILLGFIFSIAFSMSAQENKGTKAAYIGTVTSMEHVPSIASQETLMPARTKNAEMKDGRSSKNIIVPGKDPQIEDDFFVRNQHPLTQKYAGKAPSVVFDAYSSGSSPTDPSLAIGPDHVFVVFNTGFRIFDKAGNPLTGQISPNPTIFPNGGCCDLTASYDQAADRWVITFLGSGAQIAVSDGPDPINDGWYTYTISQINDYQKLSVWSDGYYMTDNTSSSNKVWALERAEMIAGNPAAQVLGFNLPGLVTSGFYSPQALNVTDANMPAFGSTPILYLQDDAWGGVSSDHVKLWEVDVDWVTTGNSTISAPQEIPTTPFISVFDGGSFSNLAQPGGGASIDALQATIMNQAQFRKYGGHNSALFNFVVDTDASGGELAGVRWFELRQSADGQPWSLYQEGTYTAPDGRHAWHASMIMDVQGNIGMGYTSMAGPTTPNPTDFRVSSYYTGRFANDPLNTMTIAEELIAAGNANIPNYRYGDYSKIDIDPSDDKTFWFINEYVNSGRKGVVGAFKIAPNFNLDVGPVTLDSPMSGVLTNAEALAVTIYNYGQDPATNFDVSYQIDGGAVVTETFTGTIASSDSSQFTFATLADFSNEGHAYTVSVETSLAGDEDSDNDTIVEEITHYAPNDLGVIEFVAPVSGNNLGMETITVTVKNFGFDDQSNFDVSYTLHGGTPVTEQVAGPLAFGETLNYSFTTQGDFSAVQGYNLSAETSLPGDANLPNNKTSTIIENSTCYNKSVNTNQAIGPDEGFVSNSLMNVMDDYIISDVNVTIRLTHDNDEDLDIYLIGPDGTRVELTTDNGGTSDDYIDTVFDDEASTPITSGTAPFTGTYQPEGNLADFDGLYSAGMWTLEITDDSDGFGGALTFWELDICGTTAAGIYDNNVDASDMIIKTFGDNQYEIALATDEYTENLLLQVFDILGQEIVYYRIKKNDGAYTYPLDMSYTSPGIYIVRLGNESMGKVKRLIVE